MLTSDDVWVVEVVEAAAVHDVCGDVCSVVAVAAVPNVHHDEVAAVAVGRAKLYLAFPRQAYSGCQSWHQRSRLLYLSVRRRLDKLPQRLLTKISSRCPLSFICRSLLSFNN